MLSITRIMLGGGGSAFIFFDYPQRFRMTKCYFRNTLTSFVVFMLVAYSILKMVSNRCVFFVIFSLQAIRIAQRLMRIQRKGKCHIIVIGK